MYTLLGPNALVVFSNVCPCVCKVAKKKKPATRLSEAIPTEPCLSIRDGELVYRNVRTLACRRTFYCDCTIHP